MNSQIPYYCHRKAITGSFKTSKFLAGRCAVQAARTTRGRCLAALPRTPSRARSLSLPHTHTFSKEAEGSQNQEPWDASLP